MLETIFRNELLKAFPSDDLAFLRPHLEPVRLTPADILITPFRPISHVHFVESGALSVVAGAEPRTSIEVGVIGREGMSGLSVALGTADAPLLVSVQMTGTAQRAPSSVFRDACRRSPELHGVVLRYAKVFAIQTAETARANGRFNVEARLARRLLMAHDRMDGDDIVLTHDHLATALGVRRPGITVALHVLEGHRMIRSKRGLIQILNREALEAAALGAYGLPEAEFRRLLAPSRLPAATAAVPRKGPSEVSPVP